LINDPRWGALGSTLLSAGALVVAISDPAAERTITSRHALIIGACVALAALVLVVNSASIIGLTYLLPVVLLVTATLPVTISRVVRHPRVTHETVLGSPAVNQLAIVGRLLGGATGRAAPSVHARPLPQR
jgi:hypothetical protein